MAVTEIVDRRDAAAMLRLLQDDREHIVACRTLSYSQRFSLLDSLDWEIKLAERALAEQQKEGAQQ